MEQVTATWLGAFDIPGNGIPWRVGLFVFPIPTGATIWDVNVTLNVAHSSAGDLYITLTAPNSQTINLSTGNGGSGDNYYGVTFSDLAAISIVEGKAPFRDNYLPEEPLSHLYAGNGAGTWYLGIQDMVGLGDYGTLLGWSLSITYDYSGYVVGSGVSDSLYGGSDADRIYGHGGEDILFGLEGADLLVGGHGNDLLFGDSIGRGADHGDVLRGGRGADVLTGLGGRDVFDFNSIHDSGKGFGKRDVVSDFQHRQDQLDLRGIDANPYAVGNQAFHFIGKQSFHGEVGEVRYYHTARNTMISGDQNGDGKTDFQIELKGLVAASKGDFIL